MKTEEIKTLSDEEMETELARLHRKIFDLRAQSVTEKLEDPTLVTKAKRDIARILTIRRERELSGQQE